ncbi:MAG: hypothetical protein RL077_1257 [Verrucomicrobiota bacterium]|jgi:hypothetical protein
MPLPLNPSPLKSSFLALTNNIAGYKILAATVWSSLRPLL